VLFYSLGFILCYNFFTNIQKGYDMGLDMGIYLKESNEEIAYWRKHPNLHGFFEEEWNKQGWKGSFNGQPLPLTDEILEQAIFKVTMNALPETEGFFFGKSNFSKESVDYDLEQLNKAKQYIQDGKEIYYDSSW